MAIKKYRIEQVVPELYPRIVQYKDGVFYDGYGNIINLAGAGATGPQGFTGPTGTSGITGSSGPQGDMGPQGFQGPAGSGASSFDIPQYQIVVGTGSGITSSANFIFDYSGLYNNLISGYCNGINLGIQGIRKPYNSAIIGGSINRIEDPSDNSTVIGGLSNSIAYSSTNASIIGGAGSSICYSPDSTIIGGLGGDIYNYSQKSAIIAGCSNKIGGGSGTNFIGAGYKNCIYNGSNNSTILSGYQNKISNLNDGLLGGGCCNTIYNSNRSSIIGGEINSILTSPNSLIMGANNGVINCSMVSNIIGGAYNSVTESNNSSIISGFSNTIITSTNSVIIGGTGLSLIGESDLVLLPSLRIATFSNDDSLNNLLVADSSGNVKFRTADSVGPGFFFQQNPPSPTPSVLGTRWIDSDTGREYVWVYDGVNYNWMQPTQLTSMKMTTAQITTSYVTASFIYEYYGVIYMGGISTIELPQGVSPDDDGRFITIADEVGGISNWNRGIRVQGTASQLINSKTDILMKIDNMSLTFMYRNSSWKTI